MNKVSPQDIRLLVDVGIKLDDNNLGSTDLWVQVNEALDDMAEELSIREVSAGTGFGIRDMQFHADAEQDMNDLKNAVWNYLESKSLAIDYVSTYYCDKEGFEVLKDGTRVDEEHYNP